MKTQMGTQGAPQGVGLCFRMRRGWMVVACVFLLCLTQIGCVSAVVFAPVLPISIPLLVYGTGNLTRGPQTATLGMFMSTENPGYDAAQNQIPISDENCQSMGVSAEDIEDFNDNFESNQQILTQLQQNLETVQKDLMSKGYLNFYHLKNDQAKLNQDPELSEVAQQYGFQDAAHLVGVVQQDMLSQKDIVQIATSQGVAPSTIQILLSISTKIKFKK